MNTIKTLTISLLLASWLSAADSRDLEMDSGGGAAGGRSYISHAAIDAAPTSDPSASPMKLSPAAAAALGDIQVLEKGGQQIYTSSLRLPSGEIAYFACEPLFSMDRLARWHRYISYSGDISSTLARILDDSIETDGTYNIEKQTAILQKRDLSPEEQTLFGELLGRIVDKRKGCKSLCRIVYGATDCILTLDRSIAYISKDPINDFCSLPGLPMTPCGKFMDGGKEFMDISYQWITEIKRYTECYAHILMSVATRTPPNFIVPSHIDHMNAYGNQGIFRNPLSMIEGNYKGLAIPLCAFTGKVLLSKHPRMEYMLVKHDRMVVMRQLIMAAFEEQEVVHCDSGTIGVKIEPLNKIWMKLALLGSPPHNISA